MFFHQTHNSVGADVYNAFLYQNAFWQTHLHRAFEFTLALDGQVVATVGDKTYTLSKGDCVLVPPYLAHAYHTPSSSEVFIAVFSGETVEDFARTLSQLDPQEYAFRLPDDLFSVLKREWILDTALSQAATPVPKPSPFALKSCLYAVCARFLAQNPLSKAKTETALMAKILSYVEENFTQDVSLQTMATALGYDAEYLSRAFNKTFGIHFKTLVNQYRCERAQSLITSSDKSLSEIAMESGFQSIRSFNRIFSLLTGKPPRSLR